VVERRDRDDHAQQRIALREHAALPTVRRDVAGEDLAIVLQRGVRGEAEHVAHAADLVARVLAAQTRLARDQAAEFVAARHHQRGRTLQDLGALRTRQTRPIATRGDERALDVVGPGAGHRAHGLAVPGVAHRDAVVRAVHPFARDAHRLVQRAGVDVHPMKSSSTCVIRLSTTGRMMRTSQHPLRRAQS